MRALVLLGLNLLLGAFVLGWVVHRFGAAALGILAADRSAAGLVAFLGVVALTLLAFAWRWRWLLSGLCGAPALRVLALQRSAAQSLALLVPSGNMGGDPLRAWLLSREPASGGAGSRAPERVAGGDAIASVAVDRALEIGAATPFSIVFVTLLVQRGVPDLERALASVVLGALGLGLGVFLAVRRLRRGAGLLTSLARGARLDRLGWVQDRMTTLHDSEAAVERLAAQPGRLGVAFAAGLAANALVLLEFATLLAAFGLPSGAIDVVAAAFATATARLLPVPAGLGVLEGGQVWLFGMLGHAPEVGLAVGLAVRLRELAWMLPGLVYLLARGLGGPLGRVRAT